jgi:hypothetical protein
MTAPAKRPAIPERARSIAHGCVVAGLDHAAAHDHIRARLMADKIVPVAAERHARRAVAAVYGEATE